MELRNYFAHYERVIMVEKKKIIRKERGLPVRSVRISNQVWSAAGRRARAEGIDTMSYVVSLLVEGYANGLINLPKVQLVASRNEVEAK